jgi:hypothetical protein
MDQKAKLEGKPEEDTSSGALEIQLHILRKGKVLSSSRSMSLGLLARLW